MKKNDIFPQRNIAKETLHFKNAKKHYISYPGFGVGTASGGSE